MKLSIEEYNVVKQVEKNVKSHLVTFQSVDDRPFVISTIAAFYECYNNCNYKLARIHYRNLCEMGLITEDGMAWHPIMEIQY